MALFILLTLVVTGCLQAAADWRKGVFMAVAIAAVQDPLRKLVPGVPGYLALACVPVLLVTAVNMMSRKRGWWKSFRSDFPGIGRAVTILLVTCVPAALISSTYGRGSWMLTVLGALSYGMLILAILVGYHFAGSILELRRFYGFYCAVASVMLTGGLIEYLNLWPGSLTVGTQAMGTEWLRYGAGFTVHMIAGFYRSPDVMGWHASAVVMFSLILAITRRGMGRWVWLMVGALALVELFLCGRRKMVYMVPVFAVTMTALHVVAGRRNKVENIAVMLLIPAIGMFIVTDWLGSDSTFVRYYTQGAADTGDQLNNHAYASLAVTLDQAGFFGSGLGVATPGSNHLDVDRPVAWQESGPSRVMVELGVPGLLALIGLVVYMIKSAWGVIRLHVRRRSQHSLYALGLMSFFLANLGSLAVSGQILADSFISFLFMFSLGVALGTGKRGALRVRPLGEWRRPP